MPRPAPDVAVLWRWPVGHPRLADALLSPQATRSVIARPAPAPGRRIRRAVAELGGRNRPQR